MAKAARIDDIKRPDKVAPTSTSRPVLITNRPTMKNDPMMASDDTKAGDETGAEALPMTHGPKVIVPVNPDVRPESDESADGPTDITNTVEDDQDPGDTKQTKPADDAPPETDGDKAAEPESSATHEPSGSDYSNGGLKLTPDIERDPSAVVTAEEAAEAEAKAKREQELENIIASGKYIVPIDAVQRRRSRMDTILLFTLAIVLAVILADVIADVGIVHVPSSVPRTHFFSKR